MDNYVDMLLSGNPDTDEIIRQFYLFPLSDDELRALPDEEKRTYSERMVQILCDTSADHILEIIESHPDDWRPVISIEIPQYSSTDDIDNILGVVESNPGGDHTLFGYFFNKSGKKDAQRKYGENHYRTAALLGLTTFDKPFAVTPLGREYMKLPDKTRHAVRSKLILKIPFLQQILISAKNGKTEFMPIIGQYLSDVTCVRRRSSTKNLFTEACKELSYGGTLLKNMDWYTTYAK